MVLMRTAKSCGPDAPMLASSCAEFFRVATVAIKPVAGESTKETVKPLPGEGRIASAEPVCSCAFSFVQLAHETAGAARTRSSLRPLLRIASALSSRVACALFFWAKAICKTRADAVARTWTHIFSSSLRTQGPIRRALSFWAMRSMPSFPTNARGYGSPHSRGRQLPLFHRLQHQLHRHQHGIIAAQQAAFGEAAEVVDQRHVELGFERAVGAGRDAAGAD